ncbi:MAG: DUF1512 domain-containing protein [Thaumarchaeota archaeon]|nr:DUF1512 domain-containing protein [Nitrososphaerota archaeon]
MSGNPFNLLFGYTPNFPIQFIIYMIIIWVPYIVLIIYGQRLQSYAIIADINRYLVRLKYDADQSRSNLMSYLQRKGVSGDGQKVIESMIEIQTIYPVNLDPVGIVKKMEHIIRVHDETVKHRIKEIMKNANEIERTAVLNMLEIASALDYVYKVIRHFYLIGKKFPDNIYLLAQLQMILPNIVKQADAYLSAMNALEKSLPLGDAIGPMVVAEWLRDKSKFELDEETVFGETTINNRRVAIIKAKGPMANVGNPDKALQLLLEGPFKDASAIVMIDAALKLEGEQSGDVAVGIGAAIGGIGIEKFNIEKIAAEKKIPLYAVIIKESLFEAIAVMTRDIAEAAKKAREAVIDVINKNVPEGGSAIIIGVGNTLGVAQ